MSKHTPGPWQVNGSHIYTADPERALLAQVFNPGSKASDYPLVENARLIAAAPDLLEALIMVRDADDDCRKDGFREMPPPARARIDAAIAKAEEVKP
jgi:hypothetical protein